MSPILPAFHTTPSTDQPLQVRAGACSLQGARRENNEDCQFISAERNLFIVADGMGGHAAGEVASHFAVNALSLELAHVPDDVSDDEIEELLHKALDRVHCLMLDFTESSRTYAGADTTVVLAVLVDNRLYVTGVGDSRAYLIRSNSIERLTTDDTIPDQLLRMGEISEEQARRHYLRNRLLSSLGAPDFHADKEIRMVPLQDGDRVLLSSDGLTDVLADEDLLSLIQGQTDPQRAAEQLTRSAIAANGGDDITCVVFFVIDSDHEHAETQQDDGGQNGGASSVPQEQNAGRNGTWWAKILPWFGRKS